MLIDGLEFDLSGLRIMPGLINAHDHLEFALFPRLGCGLYRNATEWARDIYRPTESPVSDHLKVPKRVRLIWGGLRNLVAGVTTVCHHNPYDPVFDRAFPVRVLRNMGWAHSLHFSDAVDERFRQSDRHSPFVIHAGEGLDRCAAEEVFRLHDLGVLRPRTVLVHALGFDHAGWELVRRSGSAVVWCPRSNRNLFGRTIPIDDVLGMEIPVALGTDSPLTAAGDLLDEIRSASSCCPMNEVEAMVTSKASGVLRTGADDFIAVTDFGQSPELVVIGGEVRLVGSRFAARVRTSPGWFQLVIDGREPVFVRQNVPALLRASCDALQADTIYLGGRKVLVQ